MSGDFTVDLTEFRASMERVLRKHKKEVGPYVTKKALSVVIGSKGHKGAVQLTPEASLSKIQAVTDRQIAGFVIRKARKNGEWPLTSEEIGKRIKKERNRRKSAVAYTRGAGYAKAAKDLGGGLGKFRGKTSLKPEFSRSKAAKGFGKKATGATLTALIVNTAPAADLIGREAIQEAVNNQARDMEVYAAKEILKPFVDETPK